MSTFSNPKLPPKENAMFKKMVKCFEAKQWKLGLKFNRQILSNPKFAEHGETLAMKGLLLNSSGRKEEADEFVKKGLMKDLSSAVCWHVFGMVQKANRKYEEAVKAYRNALKWDKTNLQIYRDLSMAQLQLREMDGFTDARYNILKLRPSQQSSWLGYSLAYYFIKDYTMACKIISEYRRTMIVTKTPPEYSEVVFFEVFMMSEAGNHEEALQHLEEMEPNLVDVQCIAETKGSLYLSLGRYAEAEMIYRELLLRNSENYLYHQKLMESLRFKTEVAKLAHFKELAEEFPRSHVIRKMPLLLTSGEVFRGLMDQYLRNSLRKGVPSICVSIKVHYKDPEKVKIIEELVTGYVTALRNCEKLDIDSPGPAEPPSTRLWATVLLAQHHDILRNCWQALELINEAIDHTPTDVQLYMIKAKICRHGGDVIEAAKWMEEARILDTADRFINCKCVKYLFRVNRIERGIDIAGLFTREGLPTLDTMFDMQSMWFQTELGYAYQRVGNLGEALKKYHEVDKHFADIIDDQYDFHGYCMRRGTLRSYLQLIKSEDMLRSHRFYVEVAKKAIEVYLFLHDHPEAKEGTMNGPTTIASEQASSETKKKQRKERKAQHRAQAQNKGQDDKKEKENKPPLDAEKANLEAQRSEFVAKDLLQVVNPLDEAIVFLKPLQSLSPKLIDSHLLAYSIHSRRRKFLLMLRSIKRAQAVDRENGELHSVIVDFMLAYEAEKQNLPIPVQEVIEAKEYSLTTGKSLVDLNREFLERHEKSLDHMIPASQVLLRLQPDSKDSAVKYMTNLSSSMKGRTLKNCVKVQKLLQSDTFTHDPTILKAYNEQCSKLFPLATAFRPPPSSAEAAPSNTINVKEMVPKNISANEDSGVLVLKETALSLAAMSDLSGDINDTVNSSAASKEGSKGVPQT